MPTAAIHRAEPRAEKRSQVRNQILEAARLCFVQSGFHSTGMAEVCQAAEMSPGNLYRYFPGKSALIRAVAEDSWQRVVPIFEGLRDDPDPVAAIRKILALCAEFLSEPEEGRLWLEISAEASRNAEIKQALAEMDEHMRRILRNLIAKGAKQGRLRSLAHAEADVFIESLFVVINGAVVHGALGSANRLEAVMKALDTQIESLLRNSRASR